MREHDGLMESNREEARLTRTVTVGGHDGRLGAAPTRPGASRSKRKIIAFADVHNLQAISIAHAPPQHGCIGGVTPRYIAVASLTCSSVYLL